jgi:hypothetical protein
MNVKMEYQLLETVWAILKNHLTVLHCTGRFDVLKRIRFAQTITGNAI